MIGYVPQAVKTIRTKDTRAISFWMYFFSIIGVIFWLIFGLMIGNYPIIFKNIAVIILGGTVLWIKTLHILRDFEDIKNSKLSRNKAFQKITKIFRKKS